MISQIDVKCLETWNLKLETWNLKLETWNLKLKCLDGLKNLSQRKVLMECHKLAWTIIFYKALRDLSSYCANLKFYVLN